MSNKDTKKINEAYEQVVLPSPFTNQDININSLISELEKAKKQGYAFANIVTSDGHHAFKIKTIKGEDKWSDEPVVFIQLVSAPLVRRSKR